MAIETHSDEHRIVRKLRGHEKRLENLEEEREPNVESTLLRRVSETATSADSVTVDIVDSPTLTYDSTDPGTGWDRSEYDS